MYYINKIYCQTGFRLRRRHRANPGQKPKLTAKLIFFAALPALPFRFKCGKIGLGICQIKISSTVLKKAAPCKKAEAESFFADAGSLTVFYNKA